METLIIVFLATGFAAYIAIAHKKLKSKDNELEDLKKREKDLKKRNEDLNNKNQEFEAQNSEQTKTIITMEQFIEIQSSILARYRNDLRDDIF